MIHYFFFVLLFSFSLIAMEKKSLCNHLEKLPRDLHYEICSHATIPTVIQFGNTSHENKTIVDAYLDPLYKKIEKIKEYNKLLFLPNSLIALSGDPSFSAIGHKEDNNQELFLIRYNAPDDHLYMQSITNILSNTKGPNSIKYHRNEPCTEFIFKSIFSDRLVHICAANKKSYCAWSFRTTPTNSWINSDNDGFLIQTQDNKSKKYHFFSLNGDCFVQNRYSTRIFNNISINRLITIIPNFAKCIESCRVENKPTITIEQKHKRILYNTIPTDITHVTDYFSKPIVQYDIKAFTKYPFDSACIPIFKTFVEKTHRDIEKKRPCTVLYSFPEAAQMAAILYKVDNKKYAIAIRNELVHELKDKRKIIKPGIEHLMVFDFFEKKSPESDEYNNTILSMDTLCEIDGNVSAINKELKKARKRIESDSWITPYYNGYLCII